MSELPASIGPYQIERELGRGGMGVVYLALDRQLGRRVAIKLLPAELAGDDERRARLRREAHALAALNHPNVATLFAIDEADGRPFLVMEHVEGESLATAIVRPRSAIESTIAWCEQIARGMAAAHDAGILHRDLKPANVRVRPDGLVKVLDFGLARALQRQPTSLAPTVSTIGLRTVTGGVLGTPGYLSPEQARGEEVDRRADVFSFGCVLFECLATRPAFRGSSTAELLAAVMRDDPDWAALPAQTPASIRRLLERCLAKDPQQRLRDLADAALELRDALRSTATLVSTPGQASRPTPNNLPRELTSLIGREAELATVASLLEKTPLLTLIGSGGCGKTRLALRAASAGLAAFPDGVWFVDLSSIEDPGLIAGVTVRTVGVPAAENADQPHEHRLAKAIGASSPLLVIDNAEHLLDGVRSLLLTLVERCHNLRILVTSREPLGLPFEQSFRVPSLGLPAAADTPRAVASSESGRLFLDRARQLDPAFSLTAESAPVVARICVRLDGIPLAIELAAARTASMSVADIDARLCDAMRILSTGAKSGSTRHATIQAAIEWSTKQLPPEEFSLLGQLGVFAGGWTLAAAESVCGAHPDQRHGEPVSTAELLTRLVSRSLVQFAPATARYRLLETLRQFALTQLVAAGKEHATRSRHAEYFLAIAERSADATPGSSSPSLSFIDDDVENIHAALSFLERAGLTDDRFPRLVLATYKWWYLHGLFEEATRWIALAVSRRTGSAERLDAALAIGEGTIAWGASRFRDARAAFERSLGIWERLNDSSRIAGMLSNIAIASDRLGDRAGARLYHERAISCYRQLGDRQGLAFAQLNLTSTLIHDGEHAAAIAVIEECLPHLESMNDRHRVGVALHNAGEALTRMGDFDQASAKLREAIREKERIADERGAAHSMLWLGLARGLAGDCDEAVLTLARAKELFRRLGMQLSQDEEALLRTMFEQKLPGQGDNSSIATWLRA